MFNNLTTQLAEVIKNLVGKTQLNESNINATLNQIKLALLEADVPLPVITQFLDNIKSKALGQQVLASLKPGEMLVKIVYDELVTILGSTNQALNLHTQPPAVIMLVGLQGAGKTTTIAKLAHWLKQTQKKAILLATADIYRPAATAQLQLLATQVGVQYFSASATDTPLTIARAALSHATNNLFDVIILDTAGRIHIDREMMEEINDIYNNLHPIETLLVVDSMTGQDALNIARNFMKYVKLTGTILTKTDGDARGGAALAMRLVTEQPIKFIGTGEKIDALLPFHPERIASRILGMGDMVTFVEEAYRKLDQQKNQQLAKKMQKGKAFDLEDFRLQLQQMKKMGGIGSIIDKLPKLGTLTPLGNIDNSSLNTMEAIINSMTPRERTYPALIKNTRLKRIALGSGTTIPQVNRLLRQFEQVQKTLRKISGSKLKNLFHLIKGF